MTPGQACTEQGISRVRNAGAESHSALFYRGAEEYLDGLTSFLEPAIRMDEPVAILVPGGKAEPIADRLQSLGVPLALLDMAELGRNPARIIPAVEEVLACHPGMTLHVIGEPIWPGRSSEEVREVIHHEGLVNLAWMGAPIRALCAYDEATVDHDVLAAAEATHPTVIRRGATAASRSYRGPASGLDGHELEAAPDGALELGVGLGTLAELRRVVREQARRRGLDADRAADLALAVDELATNTIRYADDGGTVRLWEKPEGLVVEVEDPGRIADPLAGRHRPDAEADGGIGLWAVNQLCDLVQLRSGEHGTVIRVHMTAR